MKTKITSFSWLALLCAAIFASSAFADTEAGFYEKDHIHGFISIGADYRGMFSEYQNFDHTAGIMLRIVRDKYNLSAGVEILPQHSVLNYKYMGKEYNDITRNVVNFTPTLNLRYKFNDMTNLQVRYNGRTSQPSMTNLLEITDDSDPLNIRMGNSKLKPSFSQNLRAFFNTYAARQLERWLGSRHEHRHRQRKIFHYRRIHELWLHEQRGLP